MIGDAKASNLKLRTKMKILSHKNKTDERTLLTTNRQLYRIGLDTYSLNEKTNNNELPLVTFRCQKLSAVLNNIDGEIIDIRISQDNSKHLRLILRVNDGREIEYDSAKSYKGHTCRKGPIIFELSHWLPHLPNECPYDRILTSGDFASKIREIKDSSPKEILQNLWGKYQADKKHRHGQGIQVSKITEGRLPFLYLEMKCGRAIFISSH